MINVLTLRKAFWIYEITHKAVNIIAIKSRFFPLIKYAAPHESSMSIAEIIREGGSMSINMNFHSLILAK